MIANKSFAIFDGDSHIVEPKELWEKYLDPDYRVIGKSALWWENGKTNSYLKVNGEMFRDTSNTNIPRHAIWRPGMTWEAVGGLDPDTRHEMNSGAWDPHTRLSDMDAMGVDQAFLYPTWFAEGFPLVKDPDVAYALARAYNDWIADFCQTAPDRLFAASMIPLQNMDFALEELERTSKIPCFRAAFIRPLWVEGRYLNHPYYDALWEALERLGVPAAVHPTPGLYNPEWTSHGPFIEKMKSRLMQSAATGASIGGGAFAGGGSEPAAAAGRPMGHPLSPIIANWLDSYMFVGVMLAFSLTTRYPGIKLVVAHSKATWMEEVLEKVEASTKTIALHHYYPVRTDTEELWKESHAMLGFDADERGIQRMPERYSEKIVWGSRYPHHDTTSAWDAVETLSRANVGESTIARMMGGNAAAQFGINLVQKVGV